MKKVLIISYYWPPAGGPGCQRVVKFTKYLPQFGWKPVVLTVKNGEFPYIDHSLESDILPSAKIYSSRSLEPFSIYKKLTNKNPAAALPVGILTQKKRSLKERIAAWARANLFIPDARVGWIPFGIRKALEIIRNERIDLIFISTPPHSAQLIGLYLKHKTGLPWAVDFRDPWTEIRYYYVIKRSFWTKKIDQKLERKVLTSADHITTVSEAWATSFHEKVGFNTSLDFTVIPNGFDEEDFKDLTFRKTGEFQIVHTGNLQSNQNPLVLWQSLQQLSEEVPRMISGIKIQFFGQVQESILKTAQDFGLSNLLQISSFIPHKEVLRVMKNASLLIMVVPQVQNNEGFVSGKIFEYIGSGRPILVIGPPQGDAGRIITQIPNSSICEYSDISSCKMFIKRIYKSWQENNIPETTEEQRKPFSRYALTEKLAATFDMLCQ